MKEKRVLYPILMLLSVLIVFALWKLSTTDTPEVKTIYRATAPKSASDAASTPQKTETSSKDFVDKDGDNEITLVDVTDPNLPISHPRNVEARLKVIIDRQKSWQTPERLAKPEVKRYYEIVESQEYLDLINSGATYNELMNFLADKGLSISRDLLHQPFRKHFPVGDPSDYEPEMRQKLTAMIIENGGYDSGVLNKFMADERASAWYLAHFGSNISLRDMNLDSAVSWLKEIKNRAMQSTEALGETRTQPLSTSEEISVDRSTVSPSDPIRSPQRDLTSDEKDDVPALPKTAADLVIEPTAPLRQSDFKALSEENIETALRKYFSPERFNRALQTLNRYGPEEGLRRLKESDPGIAKQVERLIRRNKEND